MTRPAREYRKGSNAQPGGRLQRDARGESRTLTPLPAPDFESALYPLAATYVKTRKDIRQHISNTYLPFRSYPISPAVSFDVITCRFFGHSTGIVVGIGYVRTMPKSPTTTPTNFGERVFALRPCALSALSALNPVMRAGGNKREEIREEIKEWYLPHIERPRTRPRGPGRKAPGSVCSDRCIWNESKLTYRRWITRLTRP